MWNRSLNRLLRWIPALLLLCIFSFLILSALPGDPVLARMQASGVRGNDAESIYQSEAYQKVRRSMGLDQPAFYLTLSPASVPDTLSLINHPSHRKALTEMCIQFGSTKAVFNWYRRHLVLEHQLKELGNTEALNVAQTVFTTPEYLAQGEIYRSLLKSHSAPLAVKKAISESLAAHAGIKTNSSPVLSFFPKVKWHGTNNRFHSWLLGNEDHRGIIYGNFGVSHRDGQAALKKVLPAFLTTLTLAFLVIVLTYAVAIPLGLQLARQKFHKFAGFWTKSLFALYALPAFWLGVLMITFLCNPNYLNWFPAAYSLMDQTSSMNWFEQLATTAHHLILPVICWTLGGVSFLTIQTYRKSKTLQLQPFILAAKAKGIKDRAVTFNHVGKNALVPAISLLGSIIPISLSGAIAIELIFSIPGMGQLIFESFHMRDYPVVMAILVIIGLTSIMSSALSDVLFIQLDPRLKSEMQQ